MQDSENVKFTQIVRYIFQILSKTEIAWQFFVQFSNIIPHEDSFRSLRAVLHEQQKDKRMDRTIFRPLPHRCKGTYLELFLIHHFEFILANPSTTQSYVTWATESTVKWDPEKGTVIVRGFSQLLGPILWYKLYVFWTVHCDTPT